MPCVKRPQPVRRLGQNCEPRGSPGSGTRPFRSGAEPVILAPAGERDGRMAHRRQVGSLDIPVEAARDLVVWLLLLLGLVFGLASWPR
jgi:hypothetical protein